MDWSTFFTLVAQGILAFLLVMGCYGAARGEIRRQEQKDAQARQAAEGQRSKPLIDVTPQDPR